MICILQRTSQNLLSKNFSSSKRFIKKIVRKFPGFALIAYM